MPRKPKHKDYLSNKEMYLEIVKCQDEGSISPRLGKMFLLLSQRYASKPNFSGYSYQDEMISAGVLACVNAFTKFKREKTQNPFAYFTQCIKTSFFQILNKEKKHMNIRDELLIENGLEPSEGYEDRKKRDQEEKERKEREAKLQND